MLNPFRWVLGVRWLHSLFLISILCRCGRHKQAAFSTAKKNGVLQFQTVSRRPTVLQSLLMVLRSQICTAELCLQAERSEAEAQLRFGGTMAPAAAAGAGWEEPAITCRGLGGGGRYLPFR